jgi:hypothetical protein
MLLYFQREGEHKNLFGDNRSPIQKGKEGGAIVL